MSDREVTTGRTPWDVAAIMVSKMGPTSVLVMAFFAFIYFAYSEINRVRENADKELARSLADAQTRLVENTKKMGDMSSQIIKNIDEMMALSQKVEAEIKINREKFEEQLRDVNDQLELAHKKRIEAERKAEQALSNAKMLTKDLEKRRATLAEIEGSRKKLEVEISSLKEHRNRLKGSIRDISTLSHDVGQSDNIASTIRSIADAEPINRQEIDLTALIGVSEAELLTAIGENGLGFSTWFQTGNESQSAIFGYLEQEPTGPVDLIYIEVYEGVVSSITSEYRNIMVQMPDRYDWYNVEYCDTIITHRENSPGIDIDNRNYRDCYFGDFHEWDQIEVSKSYNEKFSGLIYGEMKKFRAIDLDEFRKNYPNDYDFWLNNEDIVLEMWGRVENYDPTNYVRNSILIDDPEIRKTLLKALSAAVLNDQVVQDKLTGETATVSFGEIAALALSGPLRVDRFTPALDESDLDAEGFQVIVEYEDRLFSENTLRNAQFTFSKKDETIKLTNFILLF